MVFRRVEWFFGSQCSKVMDKVMDRAARYRHQANHARQLADAAWQLDLADMLRCIAKDYDEVAENIEAGAAEIHHRELRDG
jgi:hypothetical protein